MTNQWIWETSDYGIETTLEFKNQTTLAEFVLRLARHSDAVQHHADMDIRYNILKLRVYTHDAGAVTEKDHELCRKIEELL
jgi:4a-hydroxytetrahydrobiopterin dehydratase